jgi:hypothetical protein
VEKDKPAAMGRPKMPAGTANTVLFAIKIAPVDLKQIEAAAKKAGMSKPEWARTALIAAAKAR